MPQTLLDIERDIQPVSEFRARSAEVLDQVRSSGRPVVLTQRGRGAAILLDIHRYQALLEELEILRDVVAGRAELRAGLGVDHDEVAQDLLARFPG